jgi:methyl-accepting chemotaxis protein
MTSEYFEKSISYIVYAFIKDDNDYVYRLIDGLDEVQTKATDSVTSIAAIAEESAAAIQEVLASGEEQLASSDQLVNMSQDLNNVIAHMKEELEKFKI